MKWVRDYDHTVMVRGKPKYPDRLCSRPDCWTCAVKNLTKGVGQDWEGVARMAAARLVAAADATEVGFAEMVDRIKTPKKEDRDYARWLVGRMVDGMDLDELDKEALRRVG